MARPPRTSPGGASSLAPPTRDSGFLVDDTGNRRFWVIPVTAAPHIPVDGLLLERDAIWSAAVAAYKAGEPNHLPRAMEQQVETENETYLVSNPWQAAVENYLGKRRSVSNRSPRRNS
jgi:predicted P-loop ATPase